MRALRSKWGWIVALGVWTGPHIVQRSADAVAKMLSDAGFGEVQIVSEGGALLARHLLAPGDEPRAEAALDDLGLDAVLGQFFGGLALIQLPSAAHAQQEARALGETVVTANRTPQALSDLVGDVSIIDRQTIERSGARDYTRDQARRYRDDTSFVMAGERPIRSAA